MDNTFLFTPLRVLYNPAESETKFGELGELLAPQARQKHASVY